METKEKELNIPENPSWSQLMTLVLELMAENKEYKSSWRLEVIQQAKRNAKYWFIAFLVTLLILMGTNTYWIYTFQSYEYVSQDGSGINNINTGSQGDLLNEPKGEVEEER